MGGVLLGMASSPVVDNGDGPVGHGEKGNRAWFLNNTGVNVEDFVGALAIAGGAKEDAREHAEAHGVCYCGVTVGLNVRTKWGDAVFSEIKFPPKDNLAGGVFF